MAIDKIKRNFIWLRRVLGIIDKTTLPGDITGEVRPTIDLFGWERLAPSLVGVGPVSLSADGADNTDIAQFGVVPDNLMRLILRASMSTNDLVTGMTLSMEISSGGISISIASAIITPGIVPGAEPARYPLERWMLMQPGDRLLVRSSTAPAVGSRLNVRMQFVDLDFGEYVARL